MKCFTHPDVDAIGLCTACNRGLCTQCAIDLERGLACRGRCENEVRRLIDLRDFSYTEPHFREAMIKRMTRGSARAVVINLAIAVAFLIAWYVTGQAIFAGIAAGLLAMAVLLLFTTRPKTRTDQFRLCPRCGYNITGTPSGKCSECGYQV